NDMLSWLRYFLIGIEQTSTQAVNTLSQILKLKSELESEINREIGKRANSAIVLLNELFRHPAVSRSDVEKICKLSKKAASDLVNAFAERGYLSEITGKQRDQFFTLDRYIRLFD